MNDEAPTFGLRRGQVLCLCGGGYRAALFHLGALTRLNELGLLAGTGAICGVAGGSILGALVATRIPWPLQGAFRDWPEAVAEPMRELSRRHVRGRSLRRSSSVAAAWAAVEEERYARELAGDAPRRGGPRLILGAAGLALGQTSMRVAAGDELRWELGRPPAAARFDGDPLGAAIRSIRSDLTPLDEAERAVLENRGYLFADAGLRHGPLRTADLEPLPPQPPHPRWADQERARRELRRAGAGGPVLRRPALRRPRLRRAAARNRRPAADPVELLHRHRPFVQLDSLESYRPDPVEAIVELSKGSRANSLHRAGGEAIASALPAAGVARLDLDYLGDTVYADGRPVREDDYLDEAGGSHAADARSMRRGDLSGRVYGRASRSEGELWLQYWFFYYYNDKGFLKVGRHEGDWEMVQVRIGRDGLPDAATFGRHGGGERASWAEVERRPAEDGEAPVVYCARGSHASLLRPGTYGAPGAPDHNDGLGPRLRPELVALGDDLPGWARWPGRWGATRRREAFEADSPRGPAFDPRWAAPAAFHREAAPAGEPPRWEPPPAARFEARLDDGRVLLSYRLGEPGAREAAPARIVAGALARADGEVGDVECFLVDGEGRGSCALAGDGGGAVRAAVVSALGAPGPTVTVPIR